MPRSVATETRPAAGPATWAEFSDHVSRCLMDRGKQSQYLARRSLKMLHRVGMRTTLDWDMDLYRRYDAEASELGRSQRYVLLVMFKSVWGIGHEQGWLPPIPEEFPTLPDPRSDPDYRRAPPPPLEDVQGFLNHLCNGADTLPGQRGYTLVAVAFFTELRASQAVRVRVDDVDLDSATIALGEKTVAIGNQLRPVLGPWIERLRRLECKHLFPADNLAEAWPANNPGGAGHWLQEAAAAAGIEGIDFMALHRAHRAYVRYVPTIPGIELAPPPRPRGDDRSAAARALAPIRDLDLDEATRLMALLRRQSATWLGHRLYAIASLALFKGLRGELANLRPEDIHLDRSPPVLVVPGRVVILDGPELEILRRWLERADRIETEEVFPNTSLTGRIDLKHGSLPHDLLYQLRQAASSADIPGRVILVTLTRFHRRSKGHVVLGDAWHAVADPEPILDGPKRPRRCGTKPSRPPRGLKRRETPGALPDLATCDPLIAAVQIKGPNDPVFVFGINKGRLPSSEHDAIRLLLKAFPGGLSKRDMDKQYCGTGWRDALIRLRKDPDWRRAIAFPGDKSAAGDYRIVNA